jgi:hypothetical protein
MPMSTRRVVVLVALLAGAFARTAAATDLPALLASVATNARFDVPARADVRITCEGCPTPTSRAIFVGRGDALYVEVKDGARALLRPTGSLVSEGGAPGPIGSRPLAGSDVLLEDLLPFTADVLKVPQISDDGPLGVVVTGAPSRTPSAYALLVLTIGADPPAVVKTQYYEQSIGNLTKLRRDEAFVEVGGKRRAGEIAVEHLKKGSKTKLTLVWREMPDAPPALFEPEGLTKSSGLTWPE